MLPPFPSLYSSAIRRFFFYGRSLCQSRSRLRPPCCLAIILTCPRPYLAINLLSLFNVLFNVLSRNLLPLNALRVVGIGLPSAFSVIYGLSAFLIYREYGPSEGHRAEDGTPLLQINPEDLTRQQLRRLLEERNSGAPSPDLVHSTYRLDLPGMEPPQKTWSSPSASRTWSSTGRTMV